MAQDSHFDMPHQLRELTERNVAQARGAYIQFLAAVVQATNMWLGAMPFNETTSGMKVIHERAIRFAKRNVEACFAFASEPANARDLQRRRYSVPLCTDTNAGLCAVQALCLGG